MPEPKNDSFRDMNIRDKTLTITRIALLIIFVVGFVFGLYFFGMAGVFELLGVQYQSIWSLVVFVVSFIIIGIIVELFSKATFELLFENLTGKVKIFIVRICFEGTTNWLVLFAIDEFMKGISLAVETEIIIAFLFAILESAFDDKD